MQPLRSQRANGMPPNILKASLASVPARNMQCTLASKGHATACSHGRTMQKSFWLSQDACARGSAEGLKSRQVMSKDSSTGVCLRRTRYLVRRHACAQKGLSLSLLLPSNLTICFRLLPGRGLQAAERRPTAGTQRNQVLRAAAAKQNRKLN